MDNEDFDLWKQFLIIKKRGNLLVFLLATSLILVTIYNIFSTRLYRVEATIMPIESSRNNILSSFSSPGILQSLSDLTGNLTSSSKDKLLNILKSRTLSENVITSMKLMPLIFPKKWDEKKGNWKNPNKPPFMEDAVKMLKKNIFSLRDTKDGLISISIVFPKAELASKIANQYVEELQNYLNQNSLSYGKKNRVFLEDRLEKTKIELSEAENKLKDFQESHKIINIGAQAEMTVRTIANLKAEILNREYQLGIMKDLIGLDTLDTNDARKIVREKRELEKQLAKLELGTGQATNKDKANKMTSAKDLPGIEVEYLRLKRQFLILEKVFELLTTQYEIAKIEEVRDQVAFQAIDKAITPMRKYKPRVLMNTLITIIGALISSFLFISLLEAFEQKKN